MVLAYIFRNDRSVLRDPEGPCAYEVWTEGKSSRTLKLRVSFHFPPWRQLPSLWGGLTTGPCFLVSLISSFISFCSPQEQMSHHVCGPRQRWPCESLLRGPAFRGILTNMPTFPRALLSWLLLASLGPWHPGSWCHLEIERCTKTFPFFPIKLLWCIDELLGIAADFPHSCLLFSSQPSRVGLSLPFHPLLPETLLTPSLNKITSFPFCTPTALPTPPVVFPRTLHFIVYAVGETHCLYLVKSWFNHSLAVASFPHL